MLTIKGNDIKAALSGLSEIDDKKNAILDINSMMTALDDYLKKAASGDSGVPINYYLKDITKDMLAEMWVAKYYPYVALTHIPALKLTPSIVESTWPSNTMIATTTLLHLLGRLLMVRYRMVRHRMLPPPEEVHSNPQTALGVL